MHAETTTMISVGTAVVVFLLTTLVLPLVRYIVVAKDRQIDELKATIATDRKVATEVEKKGDAVHGELYTKIHTLELQVTKLQGEVELANGVHSRLDKLTDRLDSVVTELGSVQTALNMVLKGRTGGRSVTPSSGFPVVRPSGQEKG